MKSVPPGRAVHARCGVLSRPDSFGYRDSLRPCIAPTQRAHATSVIPIRPLSSDSRELRDDPVAVGGERLFLAVRHQVDVELVDADRLELA